MILTHISQFSHSDFLSNSQVLVSLRNPEENSNDPIKIRVIVPVAFIQEKDVPIWNHETGTSYFEPRTQHNSKSTNPHYRIN